MAGSSRFNGSKVCWADRAKDSPGADACSAPDLAWWAGETAARLRGVRDLVENLIPWALPEYSSLFLLRVAPIEQITLASLPAALRGVENQVAESLNNHQTARRKEAPRGCCSAGFPSASKTPPGSRKRSSRSPTTPINWWTKWISVFSTTPERKLFSTGYNVSTGKLDPYHYDLLGVRSANGGFHCRRQR